MKNCQIICCMIITMLCICGCSDPADPAGEEIPNEITAQQKESDVYRETLGQSIRNRKTAIDNAQRGYQEVEQLTSPTVMALLPPEDRLDILDQKEELLELRRQQLEIQSQDIDEYIGLMAPEERDRLEVLAKKHDAGYATYEEFIELGELAPWYSK